DVEVGVERAQRGVELAAAVPQVAPGGRDRPGGVVAVVGGEHHRQVGVEPGGQAGHQLTGPVAAVQHDAGQVREAGGGVGRGEGDEHVGAIAGGDAQLAVGQPLDDVLDVHPAHEHPLGLPPEVGRV